MQDLLNKTISYMTSKGAKFADIRVEDYIINHIELREGTVYRASTSNIRGASIRVLYKGGLGFSSTNKLEQDSLRSSADSALKQARVLGEKGVSTGIYEISSRYDIVKEDIKIDPRNVDIDIKIRDLVELDKMVRKYGRKVKALTIKYIDLVRKIFYASSENRYIEQEQCYSWLYIWVTGKEGDVLASFRKEFGTRKGYYLFKKHDMDELAKSVAEPMEKQFRAKTPRTGLFPVVLSPEVVGAFVHEAFGHLAEADLTISGSILKNRIGEKLASSLVTIVDDPSVPDAFGTIKYDDEGVEAVPVHIVVNGVLKQLMTDRRYAYYLNTKPTGNARAEDYNVPPLIRMRTIYVKPRDMNTEELFEGIDFGYYIASFRGGQANLDGTFQIGIQEAYEINKGEIGDPVRNMSISGNTIETLKHVTGVGKDFNIYYGRCSKGQTVFVSDGGPHIRVEKILIGGSL